MSASDIGLGTFAAPKSATTQVLDRQRQLNTRTVPPVMQAIEDLSEKTKVYIFNVGPWQHTQFMGSLGRKVIPACPEGQKFSKPLIIPGIVSELYPDSEKTMKREMSEGDKVAHEILNEGPFHLKQNSLRRVGVSISKQWPPTKEEIDTAWQALCAGELESLIREANSAAATGPQAMEQTITERHFMAARLLKKSAADCPWIARAIETRERVECQFCGEPMKKGLARCPNCKEIVDQKLYDQLTAKK